MASRLVFSGLEEGVLVRETSHANPETEVAVRNSRTATVATKFKNWPRLRVSAQLDSVTAQSSTDFSAFVKIKSASAGLNLQGSSVRLKCW